MELTIFTYILLKKIFCWIRAQMHLLCSQNHHIHPSSNKCRVKISNFDWHSLPVKKHNSPLHIVRGNYVFYLHMIHIQNKYNNFLILSFFKIHQMFKIRVAMADNDRTTVINKRINRCEPTAMLCNKLENNLNWTYPSNFNSPYLWPSLASATEADCWRPLPAETLHPRPPLYTTKRSRSFTIFEKSTYIYLWRNSNELSTHARSIVDSFSNYLLSSYTKMILV